MKTIQIIWFEEVLMTNKVVREKSRCGNFVPDKSRFSNQTFNKKIGCNNINSVLFVYLPSSNMLTYCLKCKKKKKETKTENAISTVLKLKMVQQCLYQNLICVTVKSQDLCNNKN